MKNKQLILLYLIFCLVFLRCNLDTKWLGNHESIDINSSKEIGVFVKKLDTDKNIFLLNNNKYKVNEIWIEKVWGYNNNMEMYINNKRFQIILTIYNFSYNDILNEFKTTINNQKVNWTSSEISFYIDSIPQNKFIINFNNQDSITVFP